MDIYPIGATVWHNGDHLTVTGAPVALHGGEFRPARDDNGRERVIITPRQKAADIERDRATRAAQQAAFARLHRMPR